jgi:hypothetical protein
MRTTGNNQCYRRVVGASLAFLVILTVVPHVQAQFVLQSSVLGNGLASMGNAELTFRGTIGQPFIGTIGGGGASYGYATGFWYAQRSSITGVAARENLPTEFGLDQNYPNPFNPTTVIRAQWPVACDVKLVVFDLLGRTIVTLADDHYPAGRQVFTFNAGGLASGVYFYRLQAGSWVQTRRLMVLK